MDDSDVLHLAEDPYKDMPQRVELFSWQDAHKLVGCRIVLKRRFWTKEPGIVGIVRLAIGHPQMRGCVVSVSLGSTVGEPPKHVSAMLFDKTMLEFFADILDEDRT